MYTSRVTGREGNDEYAWMEGWAQAVCEQAQLACPATPRRPSTRMGWACLHTRNCTFAHLNGMKGKKGTPIWLQKHSTGLVGRTWSQRGLETTYRCIKWCVALAGREM
eukprot:EG_transcript_23640